MKLRQFLFIPLLAIALASCGPVAKVGEFVSAATTAITAPVNMYRVKLTYDITLAGANKYQDWCWGKRTGVPVLLSYDQIMADPVGRALCKDRRATVRKMQTAKAKTRTAINKAEDFGENPPQNLVSGALTAVTAFQAIVEAKRVP